MQRTITLEQKLAAMREVQRIYALAQKWRPVMPNQKRPNFEAQADAVLKRAMNAQIVGRAAPLDIRDGKLMHEHDPRTARIIERTLRNGIVHPDVLHSFQSGRIKQPPAYPDHRIHELPHDPDLTDFNLYIQHSDQDSVTLCRGTVSYPEPTSSRPTRSWSRLQTATPYRAR